MFQQFSYNDDSLNFQNPEYAFETSSPMSYSTFSSSYDSEISSPYSSFDSPDTTSLCSPSSFEGNFDPNPEMFVEIATQTDVNTVHPIQTVFPQQQQQQQQIIQSNMNINMSPYQIHQMQNNPTSAINPLSSPIINTSPINSSPQPIRNPFEIRRFDSIATTSSNAMQTEPTGQQPYYAAFQNMTANDSVQKNLKRTRDTGAELSVVLPKEILAKASCADLEEHVKQVQKVRDLTELEEHAIKRQRRLIKNRDYSTTSRKKTKKEITELSGENQQLRQENDVLKQTVQVLQKENNRLVFENSQYRATLSGLGYSTQQNQVASNTSMMPQFLSQQYSNTMYTLNGVGNGPRLVENNMTPTTINLNSQNDNQMQYINYLPTPPQNPLNSINLKSNAALTTLCLFVILFSFGLFLGPHIFPSTSNIDQINMKGSSRALFGSEVNPLHVIHNAEFTSNSKHNFIHEHSTNRKGHVSSTWGFDIENYVNTSQTQSSDQPLKVS